MSQREIGWTELTTAQNRKIYLKKDTDRRLVLIRRSDGSLGEITFAHFEDLLNQLGKPCLVCGAGKLEFFDFVELSDIQLICGECESHYILVGEELWLCD